jgi:hypothetical protein
LAPVSPRFSHGFAYNKHEKKKRLNKEIKERKSACGESVTENQEPRTENQEPGTKNREPRTRN